MHQAEGAAGGQALDRASGSTGTGRMRSPDWRSTLLLFGAASLLAVVLILVLSARLTFKGDEWAYIVDRRITLAWLLRPHNEHLVFLHVLVYRGMVELFGIGSYLPFQVALMVAHVTMAGGVLVLMRRAVPAEGALAAAVLMLFLGSGFDNLVWAFQVGFVGAAALGVWAMANSERHIVAGLLLTAALWTQGDALFYVAPTAVLLGRRWWVVAFPVATYAAWYLLTGQGTTTIDGPFLPYALRLVGSIFGGISGVGWVLGLAACAGVLGALATRRPSRFVVAGAVGLLSQIVILSLTRAHLGAGQAEASRYIYVAVPFVLLLLTGVHLPRLVWASLFVVALVLNVLALPAGVAVFQSAIQDEQAIPMERRLAPYRLGSP